MEQLRFSFHDSALDSPLLGTPLADCDSDDLKIILDCLACLQQYGVGNSYMLSLVKEALLCAEEGEK